MTAIILTSQKSKFKSFVKLRASRIKNNIHPESAAKRRGAVIIKINNLQYGEIEFVTKDIQVTTLSVATKNRNISVF